MIYSLRRGAARFIDYLLWGMLTITVLGDKIGDVYSPSWLFYTSFWLYIFAEAACVSVFATTPGKRLLGIYVRDQNQNKLSFAVSLKRAFLVFGAGVGFFLSYVSLILPVYALYRLLKHQPVFWDMVCDTSVSSVKTTVIDKLLLTAFILFILFGYFLTARTAFVQREFDFGVIEDSVLASYFEEIRPQMVMALSEESVLSPKAAMQTARSLKKVQIMLLEQREELLLIKQSLEKRIRKMPVDEMRFIRQKQLDRFMEKMNNFLFAESMRVSLFENILKFFESEENNQYTFINGRPVFQNPEMARQYDNYMTQLQVFLSLPM